MLDVGRDQGPVGRAEENARVGGSGGQRELDPQAGMKPNTFYRNLPPDGPLVSHTGTQI